MKGRYNITVSNNRSSFTLDIKRNVTVIKGNSGTGKTTLIDMLCAWSENGRKSGIKCISNVNFVIFRESTDWSGKLNELHNTIIFVDENVSYIRTTEFAGKFLKSDCYIVIVSRTAQLKSLPYSVDEIYRLDTTSKSGKIYYIKMFNKYYNKEFNMIPDLVITEDSNSGNEMMELLFNCDVVSAHGNSNIKGTLLEYIDDYNSIFIIADGACFGGYIQEILDLADVHGNICIFTPESFEYMLLNTDYICKYVKNELSETYNYCDSSEYLSWERYFTALLNKILSENYYTDYTKSHLCDFMKSEKFMKAVKNQITDINWDKMNKQ